MSVDDGIRAILVEAEAELAAAEAEAAVANMRVEKARSRVNALRAALGDDPLPPERPKRKIGKTDIDRAWTLLKHWHDTGQTEVFQLEACDYIGVKQGVMSFTFAWLVANKKIVETERVKNRRKVYEVVVA